MFFIFFLATTFFLDTARASSPFGFAVSGWRGQTQLQQDPAPKTPLVPQPAPAAPAPQNNPGKPAPPPKKVYTNDNLPGGSPGFSGVDFSQINDCDRNCFEQNRQLAHISPGSNPNWKRELLQALEPVRKDAEWQQYLRDLYDFHVRMCKLGDDKREELAKNADPRNVTPRELAIDDKFDAKFKEAQTALDTLYTRQGPLQRKFAANPFSLQFSQIQVSRIQNAPCSGQGYPYPNQPDPEDP